MAAKKKKKAVGKKKKKGTTRAPSPPPAPTPPGDDDDEDFDDDDDDEDLEDGVSGDPDDDDENEGDGSEDEDEDDENEGDGSEDEDEDEEPAAAPPPVSKMTKAEAKALLKEWFENQKQIDEFEAKRAKFDERKAEIAKKLAAAGWKQVKFRGSVLTISAGGKKRGPTIRRKSLEEGIEDLGS